MCERLTFSSIDSDFDLRAPFGTPFIIGNFSTIYLYKCPRGCIFIRDAEVICWPSSRGAPLCCNTVLFVFGPSCWGVVRSPLLNTPSNSEGLRCDHASLVAPQNIVPLPHVNVNQNLWHVGWRSTLRRRGRRKPQYHAAAAKASRYGAIPTLKDRHSFSLPCLWTANGRRVGDNSGTSNTRTTFL